MPPNGRWDLTRAFKGLMFMGPCIVITF